MGGGLIQLVAYGYDDVYLTTDPQITFFKVVYRRHTNFSIEQVPQYFLNKANFGKRSTCIVSKTADLVGSAMIVVTLPMINKFTDDRLKFAWVKKIGFSLIKSVEIEINGKVIDRHYGEWLNIWSELTGQINGEHSRGLKNMIGDVEENTNFTSGKDKYTLYIPLQFWFCRSSGSALPLINLQYCDVKINVEFEDVEKCYMLTPSHYIQCRDDIVNFIPNEYIEQNIDGDIRAGIFIDYDINKKRLYYYKITDKKLLSYTVDSTFDVSTSNKTNIDIILNSYKGLQYLITGKTSGYFTYAEFNNKTTTYSSVKLRNVNFSDSFILIDYYYLDEDERYKFAQSKHDYIIEQLQFTPNIAINETNYSAKIVAMHPTKLITWVVQMNYIKSSKDYYNYTNSYQNKILDTENFDSKIGEPVGKSLINSQTVYINGNPRLSMRNADYFDTLQVIQHTKVSPSTGINMYSYGVLPFVVQPTGTCNMSQINTTEINLKLDQNININNGATFRSYSLGYNVLRMINGLADTVFI
jgi:hypothetical protein